MIYVVIQLYSVRHYEFGRQTSSGYAVQFDVLAMQDTEVLFRDSTHESNARISKDL